MKPKFTSVKGISESRRLPRLGIIRLGMKKKSSKGSEYPVETDYFVLTDAPGVAARFGDTPKDLPIVFPVNNRDVVFPQSLKWYGQSTGLKCQGNGETALRYDSDKKAYIEMACPCDLYNKPKGCSLHGVLSFFIPDVSWGGIYQIRTSSFNSIQNINSALDMYEGMLGRISMVTFWLTRRESIITYEGQKRKHYILGLEFRGSTAEIMQIQENNKIFLLQQPKYQLEAPEEVNPEADVPDEVDVENADTYKEEGKTYGSIDEAKDEPMTIEQTRKLRDLMDKIGGMQDKNDQNNFFNWWLKEYNETKTTAAAERFIKNFNSILSKYLDITIGPSDKEFYDEGAN